MADAEPGAPTQRVAVVASLARSLVNFRLELLKRIVGQGHQVVTYAPEDDPETSATLRGLGIEPRTFPMSRAGVNPLEDMATVRALTAMFREDRPDVMLPYTMKPIVYGNMAAQAAGVPRRFALFTGLGYTFTDTGPSAKRLAVRAVAIRLHRRALRGLERAFVYNPAEEADIRTFRLIEPATPITFIRGSGVDTALYTPHPLPEGRVRFLMVARMLRSKGVHLFIEAARQLRARGVDFDAALLGPVDDNPDSLTARDLARLNEEGVVRYLGETRDVRPFIAEATVLVLPSLYREGIPRTVLEALSMGRPAIVSDVPGCAHSVRDGETGFIVPAGSAEAIAAAMERMVADRDMVARMAVAARAQACEDFDVHDINRRLLTHMGLERQA